MSSGFQVNGVDLDSILKARVNTKRADVGFQVSGSDISNRYESIAYGSAPIATGFLVGSADLNTLFAAKLATITVIDNSSGMFGTYTTPDCAAGTYSVTAVKGSGWTLVHLRITGAASGNGEWSSGGAAITQNFTVADGNTIVLESWLT